MGRTALASLAVCIVALAGCLPVTSRLPVGSTVGFRPDTMLVGSWKAVPSEKAGAADVRFLPNKDGTMTAIVVSEEDWSEYRLRVAQLGGNRFMNAQEISNSGEAAHGPLSEQHVLLLYRAPVMGSLVLYQIDDKAAAVAIRAGEISGDIEPGKDGDVHITADQPALDNFMRTARAARLFSKELVRLVPSR